MAAEIQDLDPTDANNTGRWPEGMVGGDINDAGRAMEGYLARWFRDTNASITATGSSNAFAVTSNRTISSLANNTVMAFTANFSITGAATLNLNGLGAKSIKRFNGNALASGDIVSGQPVTVIYKSSPDVWYMMSAAAALTGNSFADFDENAAPGDPAANAGRLYAKDDGSGTTILAYRDSAAVESVLGGIATQAQMEAASSNIKGVSPGRQHFHPGMPKAAGRVDSSGNVVGTAYNIASVSQTGTGVYRVTLTNAMADTNYWIVASAVTDGTPGNSCLVSWAVVSSTVFDITTKRAFDGSDKDAAFSFAVFGDM
jgi:hypothetical protein